MTRQIHVAAAFAFALAAACGSTNQSSTGRMGPQGGVVTTASGLELSVPAGALASEVEIRVVEAQPRDGALHRFELEPRGLKLAAKARITVRHSADSGPVKLVEMENETEHAIENEREDASHDSREGEVDHLGIIEMRHQHACATDCGAGFECDDGVCKADDAAPLACDPACAAGTHCDNGICKPDDAGQPGTCDPACDVGFECDATDHVCKPHGGKSGS
jgi:hypothetical protein